MSRLRRVVGVVVTVLSAMLVWTALVLPGRLDRLGPGALVRLPLEAVLIGALSLVVRGRWRLVAAVLGGTLLGLVVVLKVLDLAFRQSLDRPFDPVVDWQYFGSTVGLFRDSFGAISGLLLLGLLLGCLLAVVALLALALLRVLRRLAVHREAVLRSTVLLAVAWAVLAAFGVRVTAPPVASAGTGEYLWAEASRVPAALQDERDFRLATRSDPLAQVPAARLLRGLRGKDVLVVFVESYGRVAVEDSGFAPGVRRGLRAGDRTLAAHGVAARSAFLTAPTFGALSWLAHATLQSGLWVDSQPRYDALVTSPRQTLSRAFGRAGWRTVSVVPADTRDWPEGRFYGWQRFYDARNVGYAGPRFGYPTMPDQFTLSHFARTELGPRPRRPVMAEIDLISSHAPWSRTPRLVDEATIGDGSVFDPMPARLPSAGDIWPSPTRVRAAYGTAVRYSLRSLISFVTHHGDRNTVLVVLGDHQPATIVSGTDAGHDVPVSIVARDPAVLADVAAWDWSPGLLPGARAPVWRMDRFRDRFLAAYAR
jgi:hypothetical protein